MYMNSISAYERASERAAAIAFYWLLDVIYECNIVL